MDIFCEYLVKRKKTNTDRIYEILCIILAFWLSLLLVVIFLGRLMGFEVFLVAGVWYLALKMMGKTNIEYEYALTNNILDVDKIMSKKTRKRVTSVDFYKIDECRHAEAADKNVNFKTINVSGDITRDDVYFVDFVKDGEKCRLYFRPNAKILSGLKKINPRHVVVRDDDLE